MNLILEIIRALLDKINNKLGKRALVRFSENRDINEAYNFKFSDGMDLRIRCDELVYFLQFESRWVPDQRVVVYKVYAESESKNLDPVHERLKRGIHLSPLLPFYASRVQQKKAAIHAFTSLTLKEYEGRTK
jgi:ADP-ribose pyrophosphatase YjhB (NUDIX family)